MSEEWWFFSVWFLTFDEDLLMIETILRFFRDLDVVIFEIKQTFARIMEHRKLFDKTSDRDYY